MARTLADRLNRNHKITTAICDGGASTMEISDAYNISQVTALDAMRRSFRLVGVDSDHDILSIKEASEKYSTYLERWTKLEDAGFEECDKKPWNSKFIPECWRKKLHQR